MVILVYINYAEVYWVAQKIRLIFVCCSLYTLYIRVFPGLRITLKWWYLQKHMNACKNKVCYREILMHETAPLPFTLKKYRCSCRREIQARSSLSFSLSVFFFYCVIFRYFFLCYSVRKDFNRDLIEMRAKSIVSFCYSFLFIFLNNFIFSNVITIHSRSLVCCNDSDASLLFIHQDSDSGHF